jgi:hypothetical protein
MAGRDHRSKLLSSVFAIVIDYLFLVLQYYMFSLVNCNMQKYFGRLLYLKPINFSLTATTKVLSTKLI